MPSRPVAYFCLALSMTLVGSYVALSKPLSQALPLFLLAWLRFGIGGLGLLAWAGTPAAGTPLRPPVDSPAGLCSGLRDIQI